MFKFVFGHVTCVDQESVYVTDMRSGIPTPKFASDLPLGGDESEKQRASSVGRVFLNNLPTAIRMPHIRVSH